jgi:hypothetical protein
MAGSGWTLVITAAALPLLLLSGQAAVAAPVPEPSGVPVTFYAHWRDIVNRAPLNTIPPDPELERDLNQGFQMPTVVVGSPCELCNVTFQNNVFTLFTLPGRHHMDPRLAIDYDTNDPVYPVRLADGPIMLYAYLSAHPVPTQNSTSSAGSLTNVGGMPLVRAEASWETGRERGRGVPIAAGVSEHVHIVTLPGSDPVYELAIPMGRFVDTIPPMQGTVLSLRLSQLSLQEGDVRGEFLQSNWRLRSGAQFPWRLVVPMENPIESRALASWILGDAVNVRWGVRAAWGAYDLDANAFRLTVSGADGEQAQFTPTHVEYSPLHNGHLRTVYPEWRIPLEQMPGMGPWRYGVEASNLQGTFGVEASGSQGWTQYEGVNRTPGPGAVLAWAALGLALVVVVRRR